MDPDELPEDVADDELQEPDIHPLIVRWLDSHSALALKAGEKQYESTSGQVDAVRQSMRRKLGFENKDFTPADLGAALNLAVETGVHITAAEWTVAMNCFVEEKIYIKNLKRLRERKRLHKRKEAQARMQN